MSFLRLSTEYITPPKCFIVRNHYSPTEKNPSTESCIRQARFLIDQCLYIDKKRHWSSPNHEISMVKYQLSLFLKRSFLKSEKEKKNSLKKFQHFIFEVFYFISRLLDTLSLLFFSQDTILNDAWSLSSPTWRLSQAKSALSSLSLLVAH